MFLTKCIAHTTLPVSAFRLALSNGQSKNLHLITEVSQASPDISCFTIGAIKNGLVSVVSLNIAVTTFKTTLVAAAYIYVYVYKMLQKLVDQHTTAKRHFLKSF